MSHNFASLLAYFKSTATGQIEEIQSEQHEESNVLFPCKHRSNRASRLLAY